MLEKPVMSPSSESNCLMKKSSCNVWNLTLQGVSLLCAMWALLLCFGHSILQDGHLQKSFLPVVGAFDCWAKYGDF